MERLTSFGFRYFNNKVAGDLALVRTMSKNDGTWPFYPYLSFTYKFEWNKKKKE